MAKASDLRLAEGSMKPSSTSQKSEEIVDIPKICLDGRKQTSSSLPSSLQTSLYSTTLPTLELIDNPDDKADKSKVDATRVGQGFSSSRPIRSSSDIGLPTGSTSYLLACDPASSSENYLEVFCSPRTFRRSVDSGIGSKEHAFRQGECMQNVDSSNNCLKVLTSASRVGSALSLNSEYTARSIGLMSSDSGSDKDLSLTDSENICHKPSQLRRFMSYPDEDVPPELCARSSQSLGDLNSAEKNFSLGSDIMHVIPDSSCSITTKSESVTVSMSDGVPDSPCDYHFQDKMGVPSRDSKNHSRGVVILPTNMLSYKYDSHDSSRDNRIRQWLQDMDSHH